MMKKKVLKTAAILLLAAGGFSSCGKEKEDTGDIPLKYQKCECDHATEFIKTFTANNILLLDAEKVTYEQIMGLAKNEEQPFKYVICNFTAGGGAMFITNPGHPIIGYADICNFPFDFPWDIDEKGIRISIVADDYEKCQPVSTIGHIYSDIILTSLKIHTK
jgi:hypothetical protein